MSKRGAVSWGTAPLLFVLLSTAAVAAPHTLAPGDTLWDLAVSRYGDPSFVRELKTVNGIADPRVIGPGTARTVIELPSREKMKKLRAAGGRVAAVLTEIEADAKRAAPPAAASPSPAAATSAPEQPLDALAEPTVPSLAP